jgi:uncharacterized protein
MPHQCVRCSTLYDDGSEVILKGCTNCTCKMFFFIKKEALENNKVNLNLSRKDQEQIEKDVYDIIGENVDRDKPIVLDLESIKITEPGKYEVDLVGLFSGKPVVYKLEEGKYVIDLAESFRALMKPKKK